MHHQNGISRRHVLATSAAVGGLTIAGVPHRASAQATRIERLDPSLDKIIDPSQPIQELASGLAWISQCAPRRGSPVEEGFTQEIVGRTW
jgi:hypothetical protein